MINNMETLKLKDILKAIHEDGSYNNHSDWSTGFTDEHGNVYDINVYDDVELKWDEVYITVYSVDTKTLRTNYCDSVSFLLNRIDLEKKHNDE